MGSGTRLVAVQVHLGQSVESPYIRHAYPLYILYMIQQDV